MDFILNKQQQMIQDTVRRFARREVAPIAEKIDREDQIPRACWDTLADLGLLGLGISEEYGGVGGDAVSLVVALEQIAQICPALALSYGAHTNLCAQNIYRNAGESLKKKYLPGLCSGETRGCMGLTEPNCGSDAVGLQTTARRDAGDYVLNGSKMFITNGPHADVALVYAKTDPEKHSRGITAFVVERGVPGFSVSKKIEKFGNRGSQTGELVFDDCRVPASNVVGDVNGGIAVLMSGLDIERAVVAGIPLGIGGAALELALDYAKQRYQFGKPISEFQLIKAKLANMYTEIEAARGLIYRAASVVEQTPRGSKDSNARKLAAAAILFAGEMATRAVNESVQIHGGYGLTYEYPINRFYRDSKLYEIGAGTSEIRRLLIADELIENNIFSS